MINKQTLFLVGAFILAYVAPLGIRPLATPDETRYAEIPREMRASGDWIVPRLNGLLYFEKPVLGYWLNAVSQEAFGETPFAVRLPSALAAGLSVLAIFLLAGRGRKEEDAGVGGIAAALFVSCPLVFILGTYAVLDGPFSAFFTLAMALFYRGFMEESPARKRWFYAGFGGASGLAFLAKGFLGFALPVLVIAPFMLSRRKAGELLRFPWVPLALAGAVVLPWGLAIHVRDSDYWRYFVWHEHLQRFFEPGGAQHPEPFWYFVPVLMAGGVPLMFLLPAAVAGLRKSWKDPLVAFCLFWFGLVFAFFSASEGKLGTYVLPCVPPLAILAALGAHRYLQSGRRRLFDAGAKGLGGLVLIAVLGVTAWQTLQLPVEWRVYSGGETVRWMLGAGALIVWVLVANLGARAVFPLRKLGLFAAAPALALAMVPAMIPDIVLRGKAPTAALERNASRVGPDSVILSSPYLAPAVGWQYHRTDILLARSEGEFSYGLGREPDDPRLVALDELEDFAHAHAGSGRLTVFFRERDYVKYSPLFPPPRYVDRALGFVFAQF